MREPFPIKESECVNSEQGSKSFEIKKSEHTSRGCRLDMSRLKRPLQTYKTPVAILDYMQGVLCEQDYLDLQECVFEHDGYLTRTQQEVKKHCSDAFLYTKSCSMIFADLHGTLLFHCEFLHAMNRCLDVSLLVADIMDVKHDNKADDGDEMCVDGGKLDVHTKTESLVWGVTVINKNSTAQLREDREKITNTNSQQRFSLRYKTLARILHLARGLDEGGGGGGEDIEDADDMHTNKKTKTTDALIDGVVRGSNAYEMLKNKCMLGAIVKYTQRSKERLKLQRQNTTICGLRADMVSRIVSIEGDFLKKATAMLQTTHCLHQKRNRLACAMRKTQDNRLLQNELDSVQSSIEQMHK